MALVETQMEGEFWLMGALATHRLLESENESLRSELEAIKQGWGLYNDNNGPDLISQGFFVDFTISKANEYRASNLNQSTYQHKTKRNKKKHEPKQTQNKQTDG